MLFTLKQIEQCIAQDDFRVQLLTQVNQLQLPDWYIAAGIVRNYLWDLVFDSTSFAPINDVDVIYFCLNDTSEQTDLKYEKQLESINPNVKWSVKNQARMHLRNNDAPYKSSLNAMKYWPEVQTAIGITLDNNSEIKAVSPFSDRLKMNCITRNPIKNNLEVFEQRLASHKWLECWPELQVERHF